MGERVIIISDRSLSQLNSNTFWKLSLVSCIVVVVLGLYALNNLDVNVLGAVVALV